jgi:uncharacterized membrane protein YcaP (DUF421 family)
MLAILTLIVLDRASDTLSWRWRRMDRIVGDSAVVLIEDGRPHPDRLAMYRIDDDDILEAARRSQGIERMDQIKYAILERTGAISVIPRSR